MSRVSNDAIRKTLEMLSADESLTPALAKLAVDLGVEAPAFDVARIVATSAGNELLEKNGRVRYPYLQVSCERVQNTMREKFRRFSGTARMTVEMRCSNERLEMAEQEARMLADALSEVLENNRGDWGEGYFYSGGYELTSMPAKQGGRNYLQTVKATFELDVCA